jgi:hypothetical protein
LKTQLGGGVFAARKRMLFAASGKAVAAAALLRINLRRVHFFSIDMLLLLPVGARHAVPVFAGDLCGVVLVSACCPNWFQRFSLQNRQKSG